MALLIFRREPEPEPELTKIVISLVGGSGSGKTSFFQGVQESLIDDTYVIDENGKFNIRLQPIAIDSGLGVQENGNNAENEVIQETNISRVDEAIVNQNSVNDSFAQLLAFSAGSQPQIQPKPSLRDDEKVDSYNMGKVSGSDRIAEGMFLSDALRKAFAISTQKGFKANTATVKYVHITFRVLVNGKPKCLLVITDYAGELIDNSSNTLKRGVRTLAKHLNSSDAAVILVSARDLSKNIQDVIVPDESMFKKLETKREVSADNINNLFNILEKDKFTLLLAITQKDSPQVDARISAHHFSRTEHDLKNYIFHPAFITAENKNWSTGMTPVTVIGTRRDGQPNVDGNNKILPEADIHQENVDIAVLFCLYNAVLCHMMSLQEQIETLSRKFGKTAEEKTQLKLLRSEKRQLNELRMALTSNSELFQEIGLQYSAFTAIADTGEVKILKGGDKT
ncbi:MAG: hypothetical protein V3G42_08535 [Oscillospiraceae bacterium]